MCEIRNNAYVFSENINEYGKILISRTCDCEPEGKDIFEHLKISKDEMSFLHSIRQKNSTVPVIVIGRRGGETRVVAFLDLCTKESIASLAVEMTGRAESVLYPFLTSDNNVIPLSPRAKSIRCEERARLGDSFFVDAVDLDHAIGFSNFLRDDCNDFSKLLSFTRSAAGFVGVGIEGRSTAFSNLKTPSGHEAAYGFFTAAELMFAMMARRYSKHRLFRAELPSDAQVGKICFTFDKFEEPSRYAERHISRVADRFGISVRFSETGDRYCLELSACRPSASDSGLKTDTLKINYDIQDCQNKHIR